VQLQPAALDRAFDANSELRPGGIELIEEGRVQLFDMDAAVLDGFDVLASSTSLRAAASGSAKARSTVSFMQIDYPILRKGGLLHPHLWFLACSAVRSPVVSPT